MINQPDHANNNDVDSPALEANREPKPLSQQAALYSCLGSYGVVLFAGIAPLSSLFRFICWTMVAVAFALGIVGIVGGIQRGASGTIRMAFLGTILSGIFLGMAIYGIVSR